MWSGGEIVGRRTVTIVNGRIASIEEPDATGTSPATVRVEGRAVISCRDWRTCMFSFSTTLRTERLTNGSFRSSWPMASRPFAKCRRSPG